MRKGNYATCVNEMTPIRCHDRATYRVLFAMNPLCASNSRLTRNILRHIYIYVLAEPPMAKAKKPDPKSEALSQDAVLNPNPEAVRDDLLTANPFFDAKDLVQVRYEMVRRHQIDGIAIS